MKIYRKREITDFCAWYLANVKQPATSREMLDYAYSHKKVHRSIGLTVRMVAGHMRGVSGFAVDDGRWSFDDIY